jgi:hypothetical protein
MVKEQRGKGLAKKSLDQIVDYARTNKLKVAQEGCCLEKL